ncbi:MAG: DUF445 family protein [Lachnospirales bacterium]
MEYGYMSPFLGALIGYTTNWIAIKMIFRPHEEKRVFGVKVPFTPSVLAKEKPRIASQIGITVSEHLLNKDVLHKQFEDEKVEKFLKDKITFFVDKYSEKSFNELQGEYKNLNSQNNLLRDVLNEVKREELANFICNSIYEFLTSDEFIKYIHHFMEENDENFVSYFNELLGSDKIKEIVKDEVSGIFDVNSEEKKSLTDIFTDDEFQNFLNSFDKNMPTIMKKISTFVLSDKFKKVDEELINLLDKAIGSTLGTIAQTFINSEGFYFKNKLKFIEYINNEHNYPEIYMNFERIFGEIKEADLNNIKEISSKDSVEVFVSKTFDYAKERVLEKTITKAVKIFIQKNELTTSSVENILDNFEFKTHVNDFVIANYDKLLNETFDESLGGLFGSVKLEVLFNSIGKDEIINKIYEFLSSNLEDNFEDIVEIVSVSEIVEKEINEMSILEAEKVVLDVVEKELRVITYLGGVLGFLVGMTPLLMKFLQ